jgi:hypothetical protein
LLCIFYKLKEARDAAKTNRQNATEAEKELNQASEKLQKNGGTDTCTKAMGQTEPQFLSDPMSDRKKSFRHN